MTGSPIVPCIWLDDQAETAAASYVEAFRGGRVTATSRYPESQDNPGGRPRGSVLTVELELAGQRFTLLNGGPAFTPNPSVFFFARVDTAGEADRLFAALEPGGQVLMALDAYPWSERFGWIQDRFGVSWQVMAGRREGGATIVPCLMFAGSVRGRAEEAMNALCRIFPGGRIEALERYAEGEGPTHAVKHGRFVIAGQTLAAMDSHLAHGVSFSEGVSFQVMCAGQGEVDRYWEALAEGGSHGPCGWLKDRFGISWQVVPDEITAWMASGDAPARDRAFQAVLGMGKLDVAALRAAFEGRGAS